jgi:multidrug efflux pump subunit AcrB
MSNNNSSSGGIGFCGLLAIVFITLRLCNMIEWSWWWVLCPLWAPFSVFLIVFGGLYLFAFIKVGFFSTSKQKEQMKRITEDQKKDAGKSQWQIRMEKMQEAQKKTAEGGIVKGNSNGLI